MPTITQKEMGQIEELLRYEQSLYDKFHHYAKEADESATSKLCKQLGDRSREHYDAVLGCLDPESGRYH